MARKTPRQAGIRLPLWGVMTLAAAALAFLCLTGMWVFRSVQALASEWEITEGPEFSVGAQPTQPAAAPAVTVGDEIEVGTADSIDSIEAWEGTKRINLLIMGVDRRCDEEGPTRTDSLMLLTLDPVGKTAGILSLPRDLWVQIPGFGVDRINQAHYFGEGFEYPGGGPALAEETVEALLGIEVDYYATVNFEAFVQLVDLLGGITVDVSEPIDDPNYPDRCYGFDPFRLEGGRQQLTGEMALKYARTRATQGGDIDRAERQQAVVLAVRQQAVGQIGELLIQAPQLWQTLQENVRTTMTLDEALKLALLVQEIPAENIRRAVIDYNDVYVEKTPEGQDVLVPIRENVRALRDELFAPLAQPTAIEADLTEKVAEENARVGIYNGTPTFGLAGDTRTYLTNWNINITEVGNADSATYPSTQIIDFGSHPNTVQYLVQLMGIPPLNVSEGSKPDGEYDLLIILGNDWEIPTE